ncbi:MAG TPA: DUF6350 family protein [Jatrophihabitantaceae bacterium]
MTRLAEAEEQSSARRSVVPDAAGRSTWLAAVWTGLGAAVVCAVAAIVVVAICWLPVSGTDGRVGSTIRAGLLTFLASVHGGLTVDGVSVAWLPLGMLIIVGTVAWRAGSGLGDVAESLGEQDPVRLGLAGAAQAASFAVGALIAVPFATLGTSRAPFFGVAGGALLLFAVTGGTAFVRTSALRGCFARRIPPELGRLVRCALAAVLVYLAAGALLVATSLVLHHATVEALSRRVGGGWGGVPVLVLGILAAPNAVIAGSAYLTGPGFAVGTGTTVSMFGAAHGTLPAFPVLAAVPSGHGANSVVWTFAALTAVGAGAAVARLALRAPGWWRRLGRVGGGALGAGLIMLVLGWQAGGAAGDRRLSAVGPSPWQFGLAVTAVVAAAGVLAGSLALAGQATMRMLGIVRARETDTADEPDADIFELLQTNPTVRLPALDPDDAHDTSADSAEDSDGAGATDADNDPDATAAADADTDKHEADAGTVADDSDADSDADSTVESAVESAVESEQDNRGELAG